MQCSVSTGRGSTVKEEVEVEVSDDFWSKSEAEQYDELASDFDSWLGSNCDSGYSFSKEPNPEYED